jgi:hypothetical protein
MPRQRWRNQVLDELRGSRQDIRALGSALHDESDANRRAIERLGEQNRAAVRDMKASVDRSVEVTERSMDLLQGLIAQTCVMGDKTERAMQDMREDIKAQTSALLTLIDEIRNQR